MGFAFVPYGIILLSISYSHTTTEWSQPRARNKVEEDTEDREETVPEEKLESHNHGETGFQVMKDTEAQQVMALAVPCWQPRCHLQSTPKSRVN